jgi:diguanylate cyclase
MTAHRMLDGAARGSPTARRTRFATVTVLGGVLLTYLGYLSRHDSGYSFVVDGLLGNAVLVLPAGVCLMRAVLVRSQRVAFGLIGLGVSAFAVGNVAYVFHVQFLSPVPYPSVADLGYLAPYPLLLAAVVALAYPELRGISLGTFLDGALSILCCAAAGSILTVQPVVATLGGSALSQIVGATYPVADLSLAVLIVGVITLKGGRPGSTWVWLGLGIVTFAVADTIYLHRVAANTYTVGTPLDGLWAVGLNLIAIAAVVPYRYGSRLAAPTPQALVLPNIFGAVGIAILVFGDISKHHLPIYAVILAVATLLTAVKRTALGFSALRLLAASQRQARTDELTQLPNRRHFDEKVQRALAGREPSERSAMLMIDLDGFKALNDTHGHDAGDELLRQIGPRLAADLRPADLLARLGGDEFGLFLTDCDRAEALLIAHRVAERIAVPFLIDGSIHAAGASVGIALCPEDGLDLGVLRQRADAAMLDAKARRCAVMLYDQHRHARNHQRLNVQEALDRDELVVRYQPQFDARTARMTGVEALVRWQHPSRGLLGPDAFLPLFEQANLMAELTVRVLEIGARDCQQWRLQGTNLRLSVNLAPSSLLNDGLIESVDQTLARRGLPAAALTLEITESVLLIDLARSLRSLNELRTLGVELSLDDYGTGYCSLTYLRDLPLDEIKIDRSFVMSLVPGSTDAAIIASTVQLAKSMGLRTVAEGIETGTALETVRALGCDILQGYLLAHPVTAE